MSGGGTQNSLRKTLGALKDTTTVNLAKINSGYKELDIAIVKVTNHAERPAKERHVKALFGAISATRPRADVAYCIHALARRLSKTRNWAVALKTLIFIHRAVREVDPTFQEELLNYGRNGNRMLNLAYFKDDSSPKAWDYSAWVRCYALYLEERLECFKLLEFDIDTDRMRTKDLDTQELLNYLPELQQLLFCVLDCQPQGAAVHNFIIQLALSMVASESVRIYNALSAGTVNLVDKFFEMQRDDALKAFNIYKRASDQVERLSEFYEVCKNLDVGRGEQFINIEQPPVSFLQAMEEYLRVSPQASIARKDTEPKAVLAIEYNKSSEVKEELTREPEPEPEPEPEEEPIKKEAPISQPPDLMDLHDPVPSASKLDENNATALAIVPAGSVQQTTPIGPNVANGITGWELALVAAPSSDQSAAATSKLAGGLDKLTLDSLYDDAIRIRNQNVNYNPWEQPTMANFMPPHNPFYAANMAAPPPSMNHQPPPFVFQPHQPMMMGPQQLTNPFGNPYGASGQPYGSYSGLI